MKRPRSGGGWKAISYSLKLASRVGWWKMWKAMRSKNTCKTCAVGMGGQLGGMVNEGGYFPEVCKKSFQAMASDLQGAVRTDFWQQNSIHQLRAMSSRQLEHSGRLVQPVLLQAGSQHYQPVSWDDAFNVLCDGMKSAGPDRSFFYASGRSSNEAGFLLQLMSRLFGTNYVNNCSYYCHQASGVGLGSSIGTGAGTVRLEDLQHADLYILMGANPSSNHPRLMRTLMELRRRGGKVIVINPVKELGLVNFRVPSDIRSLLFGSEISSTYVQPHIGGDLALLTGMAREILQRDAHNLEFIEKHTENFQEFAEEVAATSWESIVESSGVDQQTIQQITDQYLQSENCVIGWCMGITHHLHGTQNVQMIANVALLRAMVGRRKAGVMPIRGHSNVQGLGSVGVTPALKSKMLQRFEEQLGIRIPKNPGYDTMACMDAAHRGEMDFALCLGGNLYGSNPAERFAREAMARLRTVVYMSITLNSGHLFGTGQQTLILPVLPRDEEPEPTTQESMFSFVRLSNGGTSRFDGPRSEVSVLAETAERILGREPVDFRSLRSHESIRRLIAELVPGYEAMMGIDETKQEFHVTGRAVEKFRFPTESGRARFHAVPIPDARVRDDELRLMTVRSEGQFNSVVYDEEDLYRGQEQRNVILMNPHDVKRMGLQQNQAVRVCSECGELRLIIVREFDVRAGNALMYYPEANVLVPRTVDPQSKTPGFKGIRITVQAESAVATS